MPREAEADRLTRDPERWAQGAEAGVGALAAKPTESASAAAEEGAGSAGPNRPDGDDGAAELRRSRLTQAASR